MIVIDLVNEEGQRPFETLMASSGSVVQRRQRSMSLSALQPVFWKTGQDVVPEFTPLRHEVENGTQEDAREQEEERERKEEISREHISFVDDTLSVSLCDNGSALVDFVLWILAAESVGAKRSGRGRRRMAGCCPAAEEIFPVKADDSTGGEGRSAKRRDGKQRPSRGREKRH